MTKASDNLGTKPIGPLIRQQSIPAAIGILVMSLNMIIDTIFVGNCIGAVAIAVITVVLPIVFLVSAIGMAVGVGGASIISRALGAGDYEKAHLTFANQVILSVGMSILMAALGLIFKVEILTLFGAKGEVLAPAIKYFTIVMYAVPFLGMVMTANPIIRAEGKPTFSMTTMLIPAFMNVIMDYFFIMVFDWGIEGAAIATSISYASSFTFVTWFFLSKNSEMQLKWRCLRLDFNIIKEIGSLGGVTLARQSVVSFLSIILNNALFKYGGAGGLAIYGIIGRMMMFALFPVLGIAQGFMPITGFNYGAKKFERAKETVHKSILYGSVVAAITFIVIMIFPEIFVRAFTKDAEVLKQTPNALRIVFAVTPLIALQLIGSAYFQSIGKALPALLLTLSKQGFFLIPFLLILPSYFGLMGIWISFPIADFLSTVVTGFFLRRELSLY
jgi:putative MATE family efflux protein